MSKEPWEAKVEEERTRIGWLLHGLKRKDNTTPAEEWALEIAISLVNSARKFPKVTQPDGEVEP